MSETGMQSKKLQWKWIGISVVLYAVFFLLPLMFSFLLRSSIVPIGVFAFVVAIGAVVAYLTDGVVRWEPAIAGAGLMLLFLIAMIVLIPRQISIPGATIGMTVIAGIVFLLSFLGAWLGQRGRKRWKSKPSESAQIQ